MMNNRLFVWVYVEGENNPIPCGELELLGGRRCLFRYLPDYLARLNAFALSPDLPLRRGQLGPPAGQNLPPIFEDAGPDRWGRQIIDKIFQPQRRSPIDYLVLSGEDRIGALGFSLSETIYQAEHQQVFGCADLAELLAIQLERWPQVFAQYHVSANDIELCRRFISLEQISALCQ